MCVCEVLGPRTAASPQPTPTAGEVGEAGVLDAVWPREIYDRRLAKSTLVPPSVCRPSPNSVWLTASGTRLSQSVCKRPGWYGGGGEDRGWKRGVVDTDLAVRCRGIFQFCSRFNRLLLSPADVDFWIRSWCRFSLVDMRYRWNGVRCVALTWLLIALSIASTGTGNPAGDSPTGSLRSLRDRIRRHGQVTSTSTPSGWTSQCSPQCFGNVSAMELKRNYRLDSVKDDILRKLRMNQPPNVTGRMPDVGLPAMQSLLSQINDSDHSNPDSMDIDRVSPTTFILLSQMGK